MESRPDSVRTWVAGVWPDRCWTAAQALHGAFHEVVVASDAVARVAGGTDHRARVAREARVLHIADGLRLPFAVPRLLDGPVSHSGRTGVLITVAPGELWQSASWPDVREGLRRVLDALATVPHDFVARLPSPRTWCGGEDWPEIVREHLLPYLPPGAARWAATVVNDVLTAEHAAGTGLVHGDFGLHNVFWESGTPRSLIDFDHACWGDPAIDIAPLVGTFSAAQVVGVFGRSMVRRAMVHRASLPLQVAAAAELADDARLRDHALRNFTRRLADGSLYDPGYGRP